MFVADRFYIRKDMVSGLKKLLILVALTCLLTGCSVGANNATSQGASIGSASNTSAPNQVAANVESALAGFEEITPGSVYKGEISINEPKTGDVTYEESGALIDVSNTADGYIMVKADATDGKLKAIVQAGDKKYQYDITPDGEYAVLPLQMGDGTYNVGVYQNVKENSYTPLLTQDIDVSLADETRPFLFPNQYVWYTNADRAVKLSYDITDGLTSDEDKAKALYDYVVNYLSYDDDRAAQVQSGELKTYLPDLDQVLDSKKGICFDYTALLAAMLRAQNIPARLAIGYVQPDNIYHAWNYVNIGGKWVWMDPTFGPNSDLPEENYAYDREY